MQQRATLEEEHLDGQSQHVARAEEEHEEYRQEDQTTDRVSRLRPLKQNRNVSTPHQSRDHCRESFLGKE
uniref:Uncharacterized protein n=1 Tax=Trichogramma kaykai TaxID=54128 RepID=A0ABD2XSD8_9HYME